MVERFRQNVWSVENTQSSARFSHKSFSCQVLFKMQKKKKSYARFLQRCFPTVLRDQFEFLPKMQKKHSSQKWCKILMKFLGLGVYIELSVRFLQRCFPAILGGHLAVLRKMQKRIPLGNGARF